MVFMTKITIVTDDDGRVIGTQLGHGDLPDPTSGITVSLTAGPGQKLHKIDIDVRLPRSQNEIELFHLQLGEHIARQAPP